VQLTRRPTARDVRQSLFESALMAVACLVSYWLVAGLLPHVFSISRTDDIVGGMWAAIAAIVVTRSSYAESLTAGISRVAATLVSLVICEIYLIFLPFYPWALALLIGVSALIPMLIGRPGDAAAAAIATAVLIALAGVAPQRAWEQPILRLADTIAGVVVGVAAAWLSRRVLGHLADGE
jgi:uncharacterized membrane protein YccC